MKTDPNKDKNRFHSDSFQKEEKDRFDPDLYHRYVGRYRKDGKGDRRPRRVLTEEEWVHFDQLKKKKSPLQERVKSPRLERPPAESTAPEKPAASSYGSQSSLEKPAAPIHAGQSSLEKPATPIHAAQSPLEKPSAPLRASQSSPEKPAAPIYSAKSPPEEEGLPLIYSERRIDPKTGIIEERKIYRAASQTGEDRFERVSEDDFFTGKDEAEPRKKHHWPGFLKRKRDKEEPEEEEEEEEEDEDEAPRTPLKTKIKRVFAVFLALIIAFLAVNLSICYSWDKEKKNLPIPAQAQGNRLRRMGLDMVFLLAGVDDTGKGTPQRTDTLMVVRLNFLKGKTTILSIPRDTYVRVDGKYTKINHAYAYGGANLTVETIRDFLGMDLDYYMIIDYSTVKAVIDAMGGVSYDIPEKASPVEGERYKTGSHTLKGEEALFYLRHRQGYPRGDIDRVQAQQAFIKEAAVQAMSPGKFYRWPNILSAFAAHSKTNIPSVPMVPRAPRLMTMATNVETIQLPGRPATIQGISYYMVDQAAARNMARQYFSPFLIEE